MTKIENEAQYNRAVESMVLKFLCTFVMHYSIKQMRRLTRKPLKSLNRSFFVCSCRNYIFALRKLEYGIKS